MTPPINTVGMAYMDYAAATPIDAGVAELIATVQSQCFANPSSAHAWGALARNELHRATGELASTLGCALSEITFTSGATESNALVFNSIASWSVERPLHVIVSGFEHPSVMRWVGVLEKLGIAVSVLAPRRN